MEGISDPQLSGFYNWEMTSTKLAGELPRDQYKCVAVRVRNDFLVLCRD